MVLNKASLQNQLQNPTLETLKNLMRPLTVWLEDDYCSIAVANYRLITVITFVAKSYIHPWKDFANRLNLVLHAREILFSGNVRARTVGRSKQGHHVLQSQSTNKLQREAFQSLHDFLNTLNNTAMQLALH